MDAFAENSPVLVERGEGNELIDVDGKRYLDAISSLWVNTLGHRVPELDAALTEQLGRVAHSTMLGNGNRVVVELAEELAGVVLEPLVQGAAGMHLAPAEGLDELVEACRERDVLVVCDEVATGFG